MLFKQPTKKRHIIPINKSQVRKLVLILLIPIIYLVTNGINHEGTLWGISFPVNTFSFNKAAVDMVKKDLEGRWKPVLKTRLQRLDLAAVLFAVVIESDWKFVEHIIVFQNDSNYYASRGNSIPVIFR
jgi:hypothetical protein